MLKYILLLGVAAVVAADATIFFCSQRLVEIGTTATIDGRPILCTTIVASVTAVFAAGDTGCSSRRSARTRRRSRP